jgi:hypothetical protein
MTQYTVKQIAPNGFEVAVWDDDLGGRKRPKDVYTLHGAKCWCPSSKARCKHFDILDRFKEEAIRRAQPIGNALVYTLETDSFQVIWGLSK